MGLCHNFKGIRRELNLPSAPIGCHLKFNCKGFSCAVGLSNRPKNLLDNGGQIWQVFHIAKLGKSPTDNAVELLLCFHLDLRETNHGKEKCVDRCSSRFGSSCADQIVKYYTKVCQEHKDIPKNVIPAASLITSRWCLLLSLSSTSSKAVDKNEGRALPAA